MSARAFTRQLGFQSGVQLNPTIDASERTASNGVADQTIAVAMRTMRGRIDKPFKVNANNYLAKTGNGETIAKNALNEAHTQIFEALMSGAREVVVSRLTVDSASNKYIVATVKADGSAIDYTVSAELPTGEYLFAIRHHECFSDGLIISVHADISHNASGVLIANRQFTVRLLDPQTQAKLYEYKGSTDKTALDDYGNSAYLPDVVSSRTDDVEFVVPSVSNNAIPVTCNAYGFDNNGFEKWSKSTPVIYFTEGGTGYTTQNYINARTALRGSAYAYGRIVTAGSQSPALILQMARLAYEVNKPLDVDVLGTLSKDEAIAFVDSLGIGGELAEFVNYIYSPIMHDCPAGINKRVVFGTSAYHAARTCARNSVRNAYGFAPKQFPIAGKNYPLNRGRMVQIVALDEYALSDLAENKINPVAYETYSGGGSFVFLDSLTSVKKSSSFMRLQSVVDRKCDIEERITWIAKDALQLPMDEAIRITTRGVRMILEGADASRWLQASKDLGGEKFAYQIVASEERPEDQMIINVGACFTGTNRQTFITLTINRSN